MDNNMHGKKLNIALIIIFAFLLLLPWTLYLSGTYSQDADIVEKRTLSSFPENFSNDYLERIEDWFKDHAPLRTNIISSEEKASQKLETSYRKGLFSKLSEIFVPSWYLDDEPYLATLFGENVVYGRDDWLYYTEDNNIAYYQGTNVMSLAEMEQMRYQYEMLYSLCADRGIRLGVIIAPNKEQVYPEYLPSFRVTGEQKREAAFADYMAANSEVPFVYPLQELLAAKENYDVYSKQDSHWNEYGAYIGLKALYEKMGLDISTEAPAVYSELKTGGDLSNMCGLSTEYYDYKVDYKPEVAVEENPANIFGREEYTSASTNPARLVLIGDSFREVFKALPIKDFSQSSIFIRLELSDDEQVKSALNSLSSGDVLIILSAERFDSIMADTIPEVIELFN